MNSPLPLLGIPSRWRRPLAGIGAFAAVAAAIALDVPSPYFGVVVAIAVSTAFSAFKEIYRSTRKPLVVEITDESIRVGDRTIAWTELTGLAVDDDGQLELRYGQVPLAKIAPYRVENYEELVRAILGRVTFDSAWLGDPRTVSTDRGPLLLALLPPTLFYVLLKPPYDVWVAGALCLYFAAGLLRIYHRIDFDEDGLRLRSLLRRTRFIPRRNIRSIRLAVSPRGGISTLAALRDGEEVALSLANVDPFEIYERARRAYPNPPR